MDTYDNIIDRIWSRKWPFLVAFFVIFTVTYALLAVVDFLPEAKSEVAPVDDVTTDTSAAVVTPAATSTVAVVEVPISINIPSLRREVTVLNPISTAITDLDTALLSGAVRYPGSAALGEDGNVIILGHSSYLPTVFNKNFQALNGIQNLEWGDIIVVSSDSSQYVYNVKKVYKAKASEATLATGGDGKRLTLVTCNSFATTDDRFIVEAELVQTKHL